MKTRAASFPVITGGCRCSKVQFAINDIIDAGYCHCSQCRRRSGAPVFAFVSVQASNLILTQGLFHSEPSESIGTRRYCAACRSEIDLVYENAEFGIVHAISIGLLDQPELIQPVFHQFIDNKLPWLAIEDDLPRFSRNEISHPRDRRSPYRSTVIP